MVAEESEVLSWRGPFARLLRPLDVESVRSITLATGILYFMGGAAALLYVCGITHLEQANRAGMASLAVFAISAAVCIVPVRWTSRETMEWLMPAVSAAAFAGSITILSSAIYFVGPTFGNAAVYFVEVPILAFVLLRRPWAVTVTVLAMIGYSIAVLLLDDAPAPLQQIVNVLAAAAATGVLIGAYAQKVDDARTAFASVNVRLRRFLAPEVADAVSEQTTLLEPHRADIAALFVDLRGFTLFTNAVAAERVMAVLDQYYEAVGTILETHRATIGGFDGDGVFAYLGDPVPNPNAAFDAIELGRVIAKRLDVLTDAWSDDEVGVGYGIGIAYGEATLGVVGFARRSDYTPVGAVVNMAARLCAEAKHGEILIDDALRKAADLRDLPRRGDVDLKGFGVTETYAVDH